MFSFKEKDTFSDEKFAELAKCKKVIDLGGGARFSKWPEKYKSLFINVDFQSVDNVAEFNPDILSDIENLNLPNDYADGAFCLAVLEHTKNPHLAIAEMHRVLKIGGKAFVYVPFLYSYHGNEQYKDYYRFTKDGLEYLFRNFSQVEIVPVRGAIETILYLLPFKIIRKLLFLIRPFDKKTKTQASGYSIWVVK